MDEEARKGFSKKDWVIAITLLLLIIGGASGYAYYAFGTSHNPIPSDLRSGISFTPYYPAKLPHDWYIDETSYLKDGGAIVYRIKSRSTDASLSFSSQSQPGNFDFDQFYSKTIKDSVRFTTPHGGTGVIGKGDGKIIGSLQIGNSWVLVSAISGNVTQDDVRQILLHLKS